MSRDGSGNYTLPSGNPVVTNTVISSTWANATLSDMGAALTQSLSKDGQTTPTANLTMGNFRLTALAAAAARTDATNAGQIQDGGLVTLGSVSGTDTITASSAPAITAYTAGQQFRFVSAGANTTNAVTLNINGLGAKNVTMLGASTVPIGAIPNGALVTVTYDGTQFQAIGISTPTSVAGLIRNAKMYVVAASASATFTADEICVETVLGGQSFRLSNYSQVINISTTGAGGMDTGAAPVSGYVALYAIYNATTGATSILATNAVASTQANVYAGANMPSGYTASALIGVWGTDGSSKFRLGLQRDRKVSFPQIAILNTNSVVSFTNLSITAAAPKNAVSLGGQINVASTVASAPSMVIAADTNGVGVQICSSGVSAGQGNSVNYNLDLATAQQISYQTTSSGGTPTFNILASSYGF